jgi:hypothetical protein
MTVGELRRALEGIDDDCPVVQSIDPEGNAFLVTTETDLSPAKWPPDDCRGFYRVEVLHPEDGPGDRRVFVLWP